MANVDPILYRTPLLDASGRVTREWIRFFSELSTAAGVTQNVQNTTVLQGQASAFDDVPQHDIGAEILNALLQTGDAPLPAPQDAPLEFSPLPAAPVDPLAGFTLPDAPLPAPSDPLAALALLDVADPAGSANALLSSANTWTGTQTVSNYLWATLGTRGSSVGCAYGPWGLASNELAANPGPLVIQKTVAGNVLIGTATDNGTDKLQVSGSVNATSYRVGGTAGVSGTFKSADATPKTITVTNGIITSIV